MNPGFWGSASSRHGRIILIILFFVFALAITIVGVLAPLSAQQAASENQQLNTTQQNIRKLDVLHQTAAIFENNFEICLFMFIPVVGVVLGSIALFNTGSFIQAEIATQNAANGTHFPPLLAFLLLFIFPFTWLEFIAYSTAFSESFWIIRRGVQGELPRELLNLLKLVLITAVLLLAGAVIEAVLITLGV